MNIVKKIKREVRCLPLGMMLLFSGIALLIGVLSPIIFGNVSYYYCLVIPEFALSPGGFIVFWSIMLIISGGGAGAVFNCCTYSKCLRGKRLSALILWLITLILTFMWYPVFFAYNSCLLALFVAILAIFTAFLTFKCALKSSMIFALTTLLYISWLFYGAFVNFFILILN